MRVLLYITEGILKLSVIVPVYNTAPYLKGCLDSLVKQTLPGIEFILVNDGSTDDSLAILQSYAAQYPQFKIINQPNRGYSGARNVALAQATGEYIGFVDSDDYIAADMFEKLIRQAEQTKADMISCSFYRFFPSGDKRSFSLDSNELFVRLLSTPRNGSSCTVIDYGELLLDHGFVWNRIYKTSLLRKNNITFPLDISFGEDTYFHRLALLHAQNVVYIPEPLYYYRQGRNGSQTCSSDRRNLSFLLNCQKLYRVAESLRLQKLLPWLNHLTLSLGALGYERIAPAHRDEYYRQFVQLIQTRPVPFPIAYPNYQNTGLLIKARYKALRLLHPLLYRALKKDRGIFFNCIMWLRVFLQSLPNMFKQREEKHL